MYPLVHIVIPVYNEAQSVTEVFREAGEKLHMPFRIFIVYDSEEDTTLPVVRKWQKEHPTQNIHLLKNLFGQGALNAIRTGFEAVKEGAILVMMADLSDDLSAADEMFAKINEGYDIVCGSRYMKGGKQLGGPFLKKCLSRLAGVSLYYLIALPTHDATNSFKMYTKKVLNSITIESRGGFELGIELVVKAFVQGYKIAEVPSVWRDRVAGKSRFKLWRWLPHYLTWYWYGIKNGILRNNSLPK